MVYVDIGCVDATKGIVAREAYSFADAPSRARRIVRNGDVIISTVRTYLRAVTAIADPEPNLIVSTGFAVIRPRSGLDSGFAAHALRAPSFVEHVVAESVGVSYPAINAWQLGTFYIALPSDHEQSAIAGFLDRETAKIDALVEKKERLVELLQEKRAAQITHAVTKGLDPNVPTKDSGIEWMGQIPAHWEVKRLKRLLLATRGAIKTGPFGSQLQSSEMQTGDIKVYNQRSVLDRDFSAGENYISLEKFAELRAFETYPGDLLITTRGSIGRCAVLPQDAERGVLHPCLMRVQPDQRRILSRFLEIQIEECAIVVDQLRFMSNATTIDVIYSESLREVWLTLPPLREQAPVAAFLDRETAKIDSLIGKVQEAIERLKEYRTALISAAVTGKIDVRGAR
jgi:type I restriction enzyme S subunit